MENLEKRVSETIERKLTDGTIERLIEEQLEKSVKSALDDVFGWNGQARKMLKERFESVMCPAIEGHDFNKYITKLDSVLTEIINQTRFEENKLILSNFTTLLKDADIEQIKLSEIFAEYCKYVSKNVDTSDLEVNTDDRPSYQDVTANISVEECGYFTTRKLITFDCEEDKNLEIKAEIVEGYDKLYRFTFIQYKDGSFDIPLSSLRYMSDFEVFLRTLKCNCTKVVVDCGDHSKDVEVESEPEPSWS